MPPVENVVGFECDLSAVEDVAVQEAVHELAHELEQDNEHGRLIEHLVELLGAWAPQVPAAVAMDGEAGRYLVTLDAGRRQHVPLRGDAAAADRWKRLRAGGIRVVDPHTELGGADPMLAGRPRQKIAAIDAAKAPDLARLLRALELARGQTEVRQRIYNALTRIGGADAERALLAAVAGEEQGAIEPVIPCFVRLPSLMAQLPAELLRGFQGNERVYQRLQPLIADMPFTPQWLAAAPSGLVARIRTLQPPPPAAAPEVTIAGAASAEVLAALTSRDPQARRDAVGKLNSRRSAADVPTVLAALAAGGDARHRGELYGLIAHHEAPPVRDAILRGLREEPDEVATAIIYVAWRQEQLLAALPELVLAAWGGADERFTARLLLLWHEHRDAIRTPPDWATRAPAELRRRTRT